MAQSTLLLRPAVQDQLGCRSARRGIGSHHARSQWVRNPPIETRDRRMADDRCAVYLQRLQKAFFGDARDAPIGEQIETLALRLDQGQPHLRPAFDAGHLDGGPKACASRRRPGYLQHRIIPWRKRKRHLPGDHRPNTIMSDFRHNWNRGLDRQAIPVLGEAGSIWRPLRDRNYHAGMTQLWFSKPGFGFSELIAIDRPAR
jgi:hypothetical protein